ncbi:MAG: histidinol dehydrogenase, partial [Flaviramulus sp.]
MQLIDNPKRNQWSEILKRPTQTVDDIESTVNQIFDEVRTEGDVAIKKYTSKFDDVTLETVVVSAEEIAKAANKVSEKLQKAIKIAKQNIEKFHEAQKTRKIDIITSKGV